MDFPISYLFHFAISNSQEDLLSHMLGSYKREMEVPVAQRVLLPIPHGL